MIIGRPKRLFALINPYGGKRRASKIYEAEIKPLFEAAGVEVTMQGSPWFFEAFFFSYILGPCGYFDPSGSWFC